MSNTSNTQIVLDTLNNLNDMVKSDPNALMIRDEPGCNPEANYVRLISRILELNKY